MAATARDDDDLRLFGLTVGSVGAVPVLARGRLVAVVSLANDVGRFISDEDLDAVEQLAGAAGEALARLG